jgi:hypothetical protein
MNIDPQKVNTPDPKKIYPTFPDRSINYYVKKLTNKFITQFNTNAIERLLSCIISDMYSKVIGPVVNSKIQMNDKTNIIMIVFNKLLGLIGS